MHLKQSTQYVDLIGPFLDKTDGVTEEAGLATTGTEISKAGAAFGAGPALGTHDSEGWYPVTLTTTHTNTLGPLILKCHDAATHLPVWKVYEVLAANVYDSIYGAATDKLQVDVQEWLGTAAATPDTAGYPIITIKDGAGQGEMDLASGKVLIQGTPDQLSDVFAATGELLALADGIITAAKIAADAITDAKVAADVTIASVTGAVGSVTARVTANTDQIAGSATAATNLLASCTGIVRGTVDTAGFAATTTEFEADDITEATADHYNKRIIVFTSGAVAGQATSISDYALVGGRGHFTVVALTEAPPNDVTFVIV